MSRLATTLLYAFGLTSKPEGVAHVFRPSGLGLGRPEYVGMVKSEEWPAHAGIDGDSSAGGNGASHAEPGR